MVFTGIDNQTVEIRINNYQYPDILDGDWDRNWLNIYLKVKSKVGDWQKVNPSLTTWDVQMLITWLDTLSQSIKPENLTTEFSEPNLSFELLNEFDSTEKKIRIKFELESRPYKYQSHVKYFVDMVADNSELKRLSADLKTELDRFPQRPAHSVMPRETRNWWQKLFD